MQLFFWDLTAVSVLVVSIAMVLWFEPWIMLWVRLHLMVRLIYHTWISAGNITRHRSRSREHHHLLWCNFSCETEPLSVLLLYLSPWYSDMSHGECCDFVCILWFVWFTILGYLLVTSQDIDLAAESIIICCDVTFCLQPNRCQCSCFIYCHSTLIWAMKNALASSVSDGSFDLPYLDICRLHHKTRTSQQRGSSSAVMQLFF
jgi:hypothetical protein